MSGLSSSSDDSASMHGLVLPAGFLVPGGFTSTFQVKLIKEPVTSKYNQMLYINMFSSVVLKYVATCLMLYL